MKKAEFDEERFYRNIAKRLYYLRTTTKHTQEEIAEYCDIERSTYACYELGRTRPSLTIIFKLSRLYDVSTDYILGAKKKSADEYFLSRFKEMPQEEVPTALSEKKKFQAILAAKHINAWAKERGVTMRDIFKHTGVPYGYLRRIEKGKLPNEMPYSQREAVCLFFGRSIFDLYLPMPPDESDDE